MHQIPIQVLFFLVAMVVLHWQIVCIRKAMAKPVQGALCHTEPQQPPPLGPTALKKSQSMRVARVRRTGAHKGYTVDVSYPRFVGRNPALHDLNKAIVNIVDKNIPTEPGADGHLSTYHCDYKLVHARHSLVSIDFTFHKYVGGAHDSEYHETLNYQLSKSAMYKYARRSSLS